MPQPKRDEPTQREKQLAHGAQSDQGDEGQKGEPQRRMEQRDVYEGPEETQQQRRAKQTNQPRE